MGLITPWRIFKVVDLFRFKHWDLVTPRGWYYVISAVMLAVGIVFMIMNTQQTGFAVNEGIDFRGGGLATYSVKGQLPVAESATIVSSIKEKLKAANVESDVMISPGAVGTPNDQILVRVLLEKNAEEDATTQNSKLQEKMQTSITPVVTEVLKKYESSVGIPILMSSDAVDPTVSQKLKFDGALALTIGSLLILLWIWLRYNIGGMGWRYGVAGIIALVHDLFTLIGIFAILHNYLQVNAPFVAALLTVLGFSIHDTIIIFDRIRENIRLRKGRTFAETVNISLLETLARSVNTILTVVFTLLALFFFGGPSIRDFVSAMLIGVIIGGYSSIFVASQLLVSWSTPDQKIVPKYVPGEVVTTEMPSATITQKKAAPTVTIAKTEATEVTTESVSQEEAIKRVRNTGKSARRR
jgi:preprotein translocase subunit SecF